MKIVFVATMALQTALAALNFYLGVTEGHWFSYLAAAVILGCVAWTVRSASRCWRYL
jgi:hypothetical protein